MIFAPPRFYLRALPGVALLASLLALASPAQETSLEEIKADTALKVLEKRIATSSSTDVPKLRSALVAFRVANPGTKAASKAASLLATLPSPLDRLDPSRIAPLEKFDWQPKDLVGVLGEHRGRHGAAVTCVAVSTDSSTIVSGGGGLVRIWNASTMRLIGLIGHSHSTSTVAITKDGKHVVSATHYGGLFVYEVLPGGKGLSQKFALGAATSPIYAVACHPDNKLIAAACYDNVVRIYDISGTALKEVGQVTGHSKAVRCVAFSPDGKTLATGSDDETGRLWDMATPDYKERTRLEGLTGTVLSVAFTPSGKTLATGNSDGSIRIWSLPLGPRPKVPRISHQGPKGAVTSLSFSSTGNTLAANCGDSSIRMWNLGAGKLVRERFKLDGHQGTVSSVAYTPDMKLLVSGSDDWTVRTWDLSKPNAKPSERFMPWSHLSHVYSTAFAPDDTTLATGSYDRIVRFWELDRPEPRTRKYLKGDNIPVQAVAYSPDGKLIAAAGQSLRIRQWDAIKGETRPYLTNHPTWVNQIAYSPDGKHLVSSSGAFALVFDAIRGSEKARYANHKTNIHSVAYSPDGKYVISGSGYYLFDKDNKIVIKDGKYVYHDCNLRIWNALDATDVVVSKDALTPFYSGGFSVDGRTVWGGNYEAVLRSWTFDNKTLTEKAPLKTAHGYANWVHASADGKTLLTRNLDGRMILWDVATGKRLRDWTFNETLGGVVMTTDGRHLAVGLGTGVIYVIRLEKLVAKGK